MTVGVISSGYSHRITLRAAFSVAVAALMLAAVWPAVVTMTGMWNKEEYSHAWLIAPLAALVFVYRLPSATRGGARWPGVALAVLAALLMLAGWGTLNTTLSIYGLIAGVFGLTWAALGGQAMRTMTAPVAFLFFMIPLPLAVYISLSQTMQLMSSKIGVGLMELLGVVVTRDGNVIELANGKLEVAEACNGLRYLFPLLSISFLLAVLMEDRWWKKAVLFLSAFPIAIGMNAVRLCLIGVLVDRYGIGMAEGTQHEVEGFVVFALCVGLLLLEVRYLLRIGDPGRFPAVDLLFPNKRTLSVLAHWPAPRPFIMASTVLVAGAFLVFALPTRHETVPDRRPLSLFPMTLAGWQGSPHALDAASLGSLGLTDYVMADYVNPVVAADTPVNFYIAYYATQRIGVQVHSPRLCIPGGGWNILGMSLVDMPAADGSTITANRVVIEKGAQKQIVYYWFDERGRRLTHEVEIKMFALVDGLMRNRSDGALVRLVATVSDDDEAQADGKLRALARDASAQLPFYVPG